MTRKQTFSLIEISKWAMGGEVNLPNVQRGFVWKPSQIENLWDSVLRGYPIGAFVLAENAGMSFDLLDGQQRATAICLGFGRKTFRGTQDRIKVFIDVADPDDGDSRRYIIRAITKSHPWGYQRKDNSKPLDSESIRRAMNLYDIKDHLEPPLESFFPYDAELPIPLEFFIQSEKVDRLLATLKEWPHWKTIENRWLEKHKADGGSGDTRRRPLDEYKCKIEAIFEKVRQALDGKTGQKIPALYLDRQLLTDDHPPLKKLNESAATDDQNDDNSDEVENLFIRLNAGGTPLRGEELNYSILKANIDKLLQDQIEDACKGFLDPARFITIAFRLFQHQQKTASRDALLMRIKPKQFQKYIGESRKEFESFLKGIIDSKEFDNRSLLEHVKYLLMYRDGMSYGLPYPIVSKLSDSAPEVVFMLLYRLMIKKDCLSIGTDPHRKMIGVISIFLWFGKGERQRDRSRLLSNVWPCMKSLETRHFWSSSTIRRAMLDDVLPSIPHKNELSGLAEPGSLRANTGLLSNFAKKNASGVVASKAFFNRDLILYAQRHFLAETFREQHFDQDDTNVPFDWDHISPSKLIAKKRGIPKAIKEWYNSNGNLRAWPYSLNRIDQDGTPAKKLDPLNPDHFVDSGCEDSGKIEAAWQEYFDRGDKKFDRSDLTAQLLDWSFCAKDWAKCTANNLKNRGEWKEVCKLIVDRNIAIYSKWHDELSIEKLIPSGKAIDISSLINKTKWSPIPAKFKKWFEEFCGYDCWISRAPVLEKQTYFYFGYPKADNEEGLNILNEGEIVFGLFEENASGFIESINIPEELEPRYVKYGGNYVQGLFTLVSDDEESHLGLLKDFKRWLLAFPAPDKDRLAASFCGLLKSNTHI
jgi:hypothetical protein